MPTPVPGLCACGCGEATALATKTNNSRGWVQGQPRRFINGHHAKVSRGTLVQQLECKISFDDDGCWRWTGATSFGYGVHKRRRAHRTVYETLTGNNAGEHLHHLCGNTRCVNPDHLQPMAVADHRQTHTSQITQCKHGHDLTDENVTRTTLGHRQCRKCRREYARRAYARKKL